jgi:hypothetical protein
MAAPSLTETLAEMLLTRAVDLDDGFDDLANILSAVQDIATPDPERDFSHLFVAAVEESRLTPVELYARRREPIAQDWPTRLVSRVAMAVAALVVLVMLPAGMAYAANGAKPGDLLYGLDRALEAIGIGDGGAEERLAESLALVASRVEPSDFFDRSEVMAVSPTYGLGQAAPTTGIDEAADSPQPPEPLREGRLTEDEDEAEDAGSLHGDDESTASNGDGPVDQPPPEKPDETLATNDDASGDTSDPANATSEVGDDSTDSPDDDEAGDPTDSTEKPADQPPTPETPRADEALRAVIVKLQGIVNDNPGSPVADKVEDAAAKANTALGELEKTPSDNQAAAGNIEGAIGDLEAAVADGLLDPGHGNRLIDQLANIIRRLESSNQ